MSSEGVRDLVKGIMVSHTVTEVSLADTRCGRHRQDVCAAVSELCLCVHTLDISHNFFREEGLQRLGDTLSSQGCAVRRLSLASNAGQQRVQSLPPRATQLTVRSPEGVVGQRFE